MNNERIEKTITQSFAGLDNIDVNSAIYCCKENTAKNKNSIFASLLRIICYSLMIDVGIEEDQICKIAFVYSNSYKNRRDHYEVMCELVHNFDSKVYFFPSKKKMYISNLQYLKYLRNWYHNFRRNYSIKDSFFLTSMLLFGVTNCEFITKAIFRRRINKVVVFSDMHLIDSLIVQKSNNKGLVTATLQHGNFETDIPYLLSKSKYFLAYGEYTKNKAVGYGMDAEKILPAGVLRKISEKFPTAIKYKNRIKTVGIILSGFADKTIDEAMIKLLISYAEYNNLDLYVKFHPGFEKEEYDGIEWSKIKHTFARDINITEFSKKIDLAIVYNSTVFVEYVLDLFPTFLFVYNEDKYFTSINWCKFSSCQQLDILIKELKEDPKMIESKLLETRHYFSASDDIARSYKKVIESISDI